MTMSDAETIAAPGPRDSRLVGGVPRRVLEAGCHVARFALRGVIGMTDIEHRAGVNLALLDRMDQFVREQCPARWLRGAVLPRCEYDVLADGIGGSLDIACRPRSSGISVDPYSAQIMTKPQFEESAAPRIKRNT
jgi:hypothetical protein